MLDMFFPEVGSSGSNGKDMIMIVIDPSPAKSRLRHQASQLPGVSRKANSSWRWLARLVAVAVSMLLACTSAVAVVCKDEAYASHSYTVCEIDLSSEQLEIYWLDESGKPFGSPRALQEWLAKKQRRLLFAMNGGMFELKPKLDPTGLLVSDSKKLGDIRMEGWPGEKPSGKSPEFHFFRIPNGVFFVKDRTAKVLNSFAYRQSDLSPDLAVQSGPMLLEDRKIPDAVIKAGRGMRRNGVCAPEPGRALFVFANAGVTMHEFANYFLDKTSCTNALYLDGGRSVMQSSMLKRLDNLVVNRDGLELRVGAMIAIVDQSGSKKR